MKKYIIAVIALVFFSSNLFAGCMKSEISQIEAKLKTSEISLEKKTEVSKLLYIIAENEHSNSELAFESYEKAMSILN
jgi:hypothetical protein